MSLAQDIRKTITTLLVRLRIPCGPISFDDALHQECVDEGMRRGYLMDGTPSMRTYLHDSVFYTAAAFGHLPHRPTQIWITFIASCNLCVDDTTTRFPSEKADIYRFNERFVQGQAQGNGFLDAFADLLHQAPTLFQPLSSNLIVTSFLNLVTGNLVEHEIEDMQISSAARRYATYQRILAAGPEAFVLMAFPREIPLKDYIQALPEMKLFFIYANDVLSFYKEELAGETTNQISIMAARNKTSKLDALNTLAETTADLFERVVKILRESPEACEAFKKFARGYVGFHTTIGRYQLASLGLQ